MDRCLLLSDFGEVLGERWGGGHHRCDSALLSRSDPDNLANESVGFVTEVESELIIESIIRRLHSIRNIITVLSYPFNYMALRSHSIVYFYRAIMSMLNDECACPSKH